MIWNDIMTGTFGAIQKARSRVIVLLEDLFYKWGHFVARRPLMVIIGSLLFTGTNMINLSILVKVFILAVEI